MNLDRHTYTAHDTAPALNLWLLSPYDSGSHAAWAQGYRRHSRHTVTLLTMAGRFWKWRMQGGALELAAQAQALLAQGARPDAILATDMLHLPVWLGLLRDRLPPDCATVLYMHENQLTYPWRPGEKPDLTYAMINWLSQVAADGLLFNSEYHRASWFDELPRLLKHYPDYNYLALVKTVAARSGVAPVGIECTDDPAPARPTQEPPLILWNQRWEYDKRPDHFFALLYRLEKAGIPFRLAVAGENFRNTPEEFDQAQQRLAHRLVHWGFLPSRDDYRALLAQADLVISTADHEFFGISVLEAICAGAFPLLPNRLSYPELIPADLHPAVLYNNQEELWCMAVQRLTEPRPAPPSLRRHVATHFGWPAVAAVTDDHIAEIVHRRRNR